jgi:ferric-dicitrate binding protein FerR (iron transport regulator)
MSTSTTETKKKLDTRAILNKAARRAGEGGLAGAAAMAINVCSLMWIRTTINYQYRYGTSTTQAMKALYNDGGILRYFYLNRIL